LGCTTRRCSTIGNGKSSSRSFLRRPDLGDREPMTGWFWKAFCGFCAAERAGAICPSDTPAPALAGGGCATGEEEDIWLNIWRVFLSALAAQGRLNWDEVFIDGSFASAKKGGSAWVKPNVAKVQSGWWWQTARVYLSRSRLFSASARRSHPRRKETLRAVQVSRPWRGSSPQSSYPTPSVTALTTRSVSVSGWPHAGSS